MPENLQKRSILIFGLLIHFMLVIAVVILFLLVLVFCFFIFLFFFCFALRPSLFVFNVYHQGERRKSASDSASENC